MELYAIRKHWKDERLISWPLQANALPPNIPKPKFAKLGYFRYIKSASQQWSGLLLNTTNAFHNLPISEEVPDLSRMKLAVFEDYNHTIQVHML